MKKRNPLKGIIITVVIIAIIVGAIAGAYYYNQSKKVVKVCPVNSYAMTEYWGDDIQSYGSITSDESQMVYIGSSQKIKEVKVSQGDHVEPGDVLLVTEVTTNDLKGMELQIQLKEIDLRQANLKLEMLKAEAPVVDAAKIDVEQVTKIIVTGVERSYRTTSSGTHTDESSTAYAEGDLVATAYLNKAGTLLTDAIVVEDLWKTEPLGDSNTVADAASGANGFLLSDPSDAKIERFEAAIGQSFTHVDKPIEEAIIIEDKYFDGSGKYLGSTTYDETGMPIEEFEIPVGHTQEELTELIARQEYTVKTTDLALRKMKNELDTMRKTSTNGEVLAEISGTVMNLQDEEDKDSTKPFLTVTASEYFYIQGSIGEFYLDSVHIGDSCMVSSWETGASTTATIISIDDFPSNSNSYSAGNNNSSSYGFKATLDSIEGFKIGDYLDIKITSSQAENGIYLENFLIRSDAYGSYVFIMDENNCLKKQYVKTGKSVWGSYTQILSELNPEAYIAFPYGDAAEGVKCEIADTLYEY